MADKNRFMASRSCQMTIAVKWYNMEEKSMFLHELEFPVNVNEICRTCLVQNQQMTPIFIDGQQKGLHARLTNASQLHISHDDGLPSQICTSCIDKTNQAMQFTEQAKAAESVLKEYNEKLNQSVVKQTPSKDDRKVLKRKNCKKLVKEPVVIINEKSASKSTHDDESDVEIMVDDDSNMDSGSCFMCHKCNIKFYSKSDLSTHKQWHIKNMQQVLRRTKKNPESGKETVEAQPAVIKRVKVEHKCDLCSDVFTSMSAVSKHMKSEHIAKKPYTCDYCNRSYTKKTALGIHIRVKHTRERLFSCTTCTKSFVEKRELNRHETAHLAENICSVCGKTFNFKQSVIIHMRIHQRSGEHPCPDCSLSFPDEYQLRRHTKLTHTGEKHECKHCNKVFTHEIRLRQHLVSHKKVEDRSLKCRHCPKKFNYPHHLKNHERLHTGAKPFLCSKCGKGFAQSYNLTLHQRKHEDVLPFPCEVCDKTFAHPQRLRRHQWTHSEYKPFMCSICGKSYNDITTLKKHMVVHSESNANDKNEKIRPTCKSCNITFTSSDHFSEHMKMHILKYTCEVCFKSFEKEISLEEHLQMHTRAQKQHTCGECGMRYTRLEHLRNHFLRAHSTQRPYKCVYCPRTFCKSRELKSHLKKHIVDKPYMCFVCQDSFAESVELSTHMHTHTRTRKVDITYPCQDCPSSFNTYADLADHNVTHTSTEQVDATDNSYSISIPEYPSNPPLDSTILENPNHVQMAHTIDTAIPSNSNDILILNEDGNVSVLDTLQNYDHLTNYVDQSVNQIDSNIEFVVTREEAESVGINYNDIKFAIMNPDGTVTLVDKDLNQKFDENSEVDTFKMPDDKYLVPMPNNLRIIDNSLKFNPINDNSHMLDMIGDGSNLKMMNYNECDMPLDYTKFMEASRNDCLNARARPIPNKTLTSEEMWNINTNAGLEYKN